MQFDSCCRRLIALVTFYLAFNGTLAASVRAEPPTTAIAFTPDGKHVLFGSQAGIAVRVWPDLQAAEKAVSTELAHIHDLAFAPGGNLLLAAGGAPADAGAVEVLTWPGARLNQRVSKHDDLVYRVAWAPSGKAWASAGADGVCQVFSSDTGEVLARYGGHSRPVLALCYLHDGKTIASAGVDQTIQLWDSQTGTHLRTLDNHLAPVNDIAVRPERLAEPTNATNSSTAPLPVLASVSDDRTVRLWQPTIGRLVRFARLPAIGQTLAWSPAGDSILVGCHDGVVRMIDPETATITQEFVGSDQQRIYAIAPAPSGSGVLAAGEGLPLSLALPTARPGEERGR